MKKLSLLGLLCMGLISNVFAQDLSGRYQCHINDQIDGEFEESLVIKNNPKASLPSQDYMSYDLEFTEPGTSNKYIGFAAASGNNLSIYFESPEKNSDDKGVGISSVEVKDKKIIIKKFYYEPSYQGKANYGFEECVSDN